MVVLRSRKSRWIHGYEWIYKKQGRKGVHEIAQCVKSGSWLEQTHMSLCDIMKLTSVWFGKGKEIM